MTNDWVEFAAAAGYLGTMIAWGCPVWGTGWYYPPYYGWGGVLSILLPALPHLWVFRRGTTRGPAATDAARQSTVLTVAPAWPLGTTHVPERIVEVRRPMVRMVRAASPRRTTRARALMRQRVREGTCTEAGVQPQCGEATIGPKPIATQATGLETPRARSGRTKGPR